MVDVAYCLFEHNLTSVVEWLTQQQDVFLYKVCLLYISAHCGVRVNNYHDLGQLHNVEDCGNLTLQRYLMFNFIFFHK